MSGPGKIDTDAWERCRREALACAEEAQGELRDAYLTLAGSYAALISVANPTGAPSPHGGKDLPERDLEG